MLLVEPGNMRIFLRAVVGGKDIIIVRRRMAEPAAVFFRYYGIFGLEIAALLP